MYMYIATLANLTAALTTGVASMASLHSYKFEIPRSRGNIDATTWGWLRAETPEASS